MNPYTPLLSNAVKAASVNTRATREFVYQHARKTLLAHLSADGASTPGHIEDELKRLDDAIGVVETAMEQGAAAASDSALAPSAKDRDVPQAASETAPPRVTPDIGPAVSVRPPESVQRRAARFSLLPPLKVGGYVLWVIGLLSNPYFLILSLFLGVYIGLFSKPLTAFLSPIADVYIELLKMVLIPFMVSAIVVSLSRLLGTDAMSRRIKTILSIFVVGIAATALLGVASGLVLAPGNISGDTRQALGEVINRSPYAVDAEVALNEHVAAPKEAHGGLLDLVIPDNIFHALTAGDNLKILFFAIAFGIGLGSLRLNRGDGLRLALLSVYDVCTQLIAWVNLLLPVALCAMVAKQVATVGAGQLVAMIRFTVGFTIASLVVCLVSVLVLAWASRSGIKGAILAIREPFLLAVATRSSITCIPAGMTSLIDKLGYDRKHVELLLPLGVTLFRFGPILYYAFTTIFVAQLYDIAVSPAGYALVLGGAMLTGLASAGTTGVLTISLLGVIFQPLGLPLEAALALLVTIDPVIDIFRTATIVVPNCAAVAVIYRKDISADRAPGVAAQRTDAVT